MTISFWTLTADLRVLRSRLRNRGWLDDDNPRGHRCRDGGQPARRGAI